MQQHTGKAGVVELEVALVVELQQCRAVGMLVLQVEVVKLRLLGGMTAVFAHINLEIFK